MTDKVWDANRWAGERAASYNGPKIKFWNSANTRNGAPAWPWAHRSFIALIEKGLPFEERTVDLLDKPEDFKEQYASIQADPLARAKVPIIELGEEGSKDYLKLIESGVVTDFIANNWKDVGQPLKPKDDYVKEAKMQFFVQIFMDTLQGTQMSFLTARNPQAIQAEYMKVLNGLKAVDVCLEKHGEQGPGEDAAFFFGSMYSLAEAMTAPFVVRENAVFKEHRNIDILDTCQQLGLTHITKWWKAVLERPSTKLTTPDMANLIQLAPYLRPVFVEYKFSAAEQKAALAAATKDWATGEGHNAEEARRAAEIREGMRIAEEEKKKASSSLSGLQSRLYGNKSKL